MKLYADCRDMVSVLCTSSVTWNDMQTAETGWGNCVDIFIHLKKLKNAWYIHHLLFKNWLFSIVFFYKVICTILLQNQGENIQNIKRFKLEKQRYPTKIDYFKVYRVLLWIGHAFFFKLKVSWNYKEVPLGYIQGTFRVHLGYI